MCGVAFAVFHVAVGAVAVGSLEKELPRATGVRIVRSITANRVGIGPLGQGDRISMPCHFGVEVEGEGVGIESLRKDSRTNDAAAREFCHLRKANCIVIERRSHGGSSAKLPQATIKPGRAAKLVVTVIAWDAALLNLSDEDVTGVD